MMTKKGHTKVDELKDALEKRKGTKVGAPIQNQSGEELKVKDEGEKEVGAKETPVQELEDLGEQLRVAEEQAKDHYDKLLRAIAEFDNFKKRSDREKQDLVKYGNEKLIKDLLPVIDDLERVLQHVPENAAKELVDFVSGVQLIVKSFLNILGKYGLKEIDVVGKKFNPELHEAIAHVPDDEIAQDYIVEQHRKGYILNERVIRAALVAVSKGKLH